MSEQTYLLCGIIAVLLIVLPFFALNWLLNQEIEHLFLRRRTRNRRDQP